MNDQNSFSNVPNKFLVILKVEKISIKYQGAIIKKKKN